MAAIALQGGVVATNGPVTLTTSTLTLSDTIAYAQGTKQVLLVTNPTGSSITLTLAGSAPLTSIVVPGYGATVSAAGGKAIAIAAAAVKYIDLDDISAYLAGNGTVTLTSTATGLTTSFFN